MKPFYGLRGTSLNIAIALIAGIDFALFGYDQGVLGGLLTLNSFLNHFPQVDTVNPPPGWTASKASNYQGITVGGYTLGCFVGAVATIWLGNWLGRKRAIITGSSIMVIGAAIQASSFSLPQLIVSRLITGFGNGMNTSTVPTWQSETSKPHRRGQMVMLEASLNVFGLMISYWIDLGFSFLEPSTISWRFPIAFQIILALFVALAIPGLPESPRWLVLKGREDEALKVLSALFDLPEDDPKIHAEFAAVKDATIEMATGTFSDCFKFNELRNFHRTVLAYVSQVFQQISGINVITYYAATIFLSIGLSPFMSRLLAALNGTEYFLISWVAVFTIERFGRRKLMLFGALGMSVSMIVLSATTAYSGVNQGAGITAAIFLFVFNSFFAIGWLGMTWLYPAEVTPLAIRAPANAISTTANWIFNFLVVMITPPAFANIGNYTYTIFAVINLVIILPCVYLFYPETSYRSLEEMDEIFQEAHGLKGALDVVKISIHKSRRYGKKGELLINYDETEYHMRHSTVASNGLNHHNADYREKSEADCMTGVSETREVI